MGAGGAMEYQTRPSLTSAAVATEAAHATAAAEDAVAAAPVAEINTRASRQSWPKKKINAEECRSEELLNASETSSKCRQFSTSLAPLMPKKKINAEEFKSEELLNASETKSQCRQFSTTLTPLTSG